MTSDDVAHYLRVHPEFFDEHADLLETVEVRHPHEGHAIPLTERQILQLRERNKVIEGKLRELVSFGEENDSISERLHRVTVVLIRATSLEELLRLLYYHLREDFSVPHNAIRLWDRSHRADLSEYAPVGNEVKAFAESLTHPYCSAHAMYDSADWFGEAAQTVRSFAYVALRTDKCAGVLALASEDPERFYPEMGTLYLKRLGEILAVAISRHPE